jgi:predicted  nucleic acid-binding Zn-ribbon protein
MTPEELERFERAKEAFVQVEEELAKVRRQISVDDVILRLRKQQANELKTSEHECEDAMEQARTWTKALKEVHDKRTKKLDDHMAKIDKSDVVLKVCMP